MHFLQNSSALERVGQDSEKREEEDKAIEDHHEEDQEHSFGAPRYLIQPARA
eukprot:CAMPEP_0177733054 /NCGR_PEP_ID=MMETSP0484_2-20121128/23461_1 /TAXON_ID=354590 /ORGANISM="Rhodomonas lens, Strain RHODO" /LENGTH=51 /DNA_ID=CAMNT_0019246371 /DNA_START=214 /DNA_END=369 /DNA_ORIENTATION=-